MPSSLPPAALHFPATQRNRDPIRDALRSILPEAGTVLEIASGSGEHTEYFAGAFPNLTWQPSDRDPTLLASISAHAAASGHANIAAPLMIDVTQQPWPIASADAVICINMIHIAPWSACQNLFSGALPILPDDGPLYLYGPFMRNGQHTAPSNDAFDRSLRSQNTSWGIRDLDDVAAVAEGYRLDRIIEMPANNLSVVFRKNG
jgi:cyclopropane fatty-acyl-phospholipid synthase-like methyltransferase